MISGRIKGSTEGRLLGRVTLFHANDVNTVRSASRRAAIENVVFAPPGVLPGGGVTWRAETDDVVVARFDLPAERPGIRVRIDEHGAIRTVSALADRGGAVQRVEIGAEVGADDLLPRRPEGLVEASELTGAWGSCCRYRGSAPVSSMPWSLGSVRVHLDVAAGDLRGDVGHGDIGLLSGETALPERPRRHAADRPDAVDTADAAVVVHPHEARRIHAAVRAAGVLAGE